MNIILSTERFNLRQFTEADYDKMHELNSDQEVMRYILAGNTQNWEEVKVYLDNIIAYYSDNPQLGTWAIETKKEGDFVGWACLRHFGTSEKRELGYRLRKKYWGKGIATEVSRGIVKYGFEELNLPQIMAVVVKENKASWRVLEKAGLNYVKPMKYLNFDVEYFELNNPSMA